MIKRIPPNNPPVYIVMWRCEEGFVHQRFNDKKMAIDFYNHLCKYYGRDCTCLTKVLIDYGKKV